MILEEVEKLVHQLEPRDQLKLAAGICDQLSTPPEIESEEARRTRRLAAIARCDALADGPEDDFDSAEDLRRLRAQRIAAIS